MSFRDSVLALVRELLREANFVDVDELGHCIVSMIDSIHSYTEEGVRLYPEVVLTTDLEPLLRSLPTPQFTEVGSAWPAREGLAKAIKRCAPLARDGWIIVVELGAENIRYGLVSVESSELSISLYSHVVGDYALEELEIPVVYLRGLGGQRVEIKTRSRRETVAVSLREIGPDEREITALATAVTQDLRASDRELLHLFFAKLLGDAIRHTHGCLVGVVRDRQPVIRGFKRLFPDGAYMLEPVDFVAPVQTSEAIQSRAASMVVRNLSSLLRGMLSHDGITVLSSKGRIVGYNVFVPRKASAKGVTGGARSRAFQTLSGSKRVICCYSISHDGATKLWRRNDG